MSFLAVAPEMVESAAGDVSGIGVAIRDAFAAASAPTTAVLASGADEVSAAVAGALSAHGQLYQALAARHDGIG